MHLLLSVFLVFLRLTCVHSQEHEEQQCSNPDETRAAQDQLHSCRENLKQAEDWLNQQKEEAMTCHKRAQEFDTEIAGCQNSRKKLESDINHLSKEIQEERQKGSVEAQKVGVCEGEKQRLQNLIVQCQEKEKLIEAESKKRVADIQIKADDFQNQASVCHSELGKINNALKGKDIAISACKEESSQLNKKRSDLEAKLNEKHKLNFFASSEQLKGISNNYKMISRTLGLSMYNCIFTPWMQDSVKTSVFNARKLADHSIKSSKIYFHELVNGDYYKELSSSFNKHRSSNKFIQKFQVFLDLGVEKAKLFRDTTVSLYVKNKPKVVAAANELNKSINLKLKNYPELLPLVPPGLLDKLIFTSCFLFGWYLAIRVPIAIICCTGRLFGCGGKRKCVLLAPLRFCCCIFRFLTCGIFQRRNGRGETNPGKSQDTHKKGLIPSGNQRTPPVVPSGNQMTPPVVPSPSSEEGRKTRKVKK